MSDYPEQTIGNAMAKLAPALGGAGGSATLLGLGAEQWAMVASILTALYVGIQIVLSGPKLVAAARCMWRRVFGRRAADESDQAGA